MASCLLQPLNFEKLRLALITLFLQQIFLFFFCLVNCSDLEEIYEQIREELVEAEHEPDATYLKTLLTTNGVNANAKDVKGNTFLHDAARGGSAKVVEVLLEGGANVTATNQKGRTPLHLAAKYGHDAVVLQLIAASAELNAKDNKNETPLITAINCEVTSTPRKIVKVLVNAGASVDGHTRQGRTPLQWATKHEYTNTVKVLLSAPSVDVNSTDQENHQTALHFAAENGSIDIAKLLLAAGAASDIRNSTGHTPLHIAVQRNIWSSYTFHQELVLLLIAAGSNVTQPDNSGHTPLHDAEGCVVKALVDAGANLEATDKSGNTPLHSAVMEGDEVAVRELLAAHANVHACNLKGLTPLHMVGQHQSMNEIVSELVHAGADVDASAFIGSYTPLDRAAKFGNVHATRQLLAAGANCELTNYMGATPLERACEAVEGATNSDCQRYLEVICVLMQGGATVPRDSAQEDGFERSWPLTEAEELLKYLQTRPKTGKEICQNMQ